MNASEGKVIVVVADGICRQPVTSSSGAESGRELARLEFALVSLIGKCVLSGVLTLCSWSPLQPKLLETSCYNL